MNALENKSKIYVFFFKEKSMTWIERKKKALQNQRYSLGLIPYIIGRMNPTEPAKESYQSKD